jgi:hypothetical protein
MWPSSCFNFLSFISLLCIPLPCLIITTHPVWFSFFLFVCLCFFLLFYYSYVHTTLGSFLPPAPTPSLTSHSTPSLSPLTPSISGRNYFALISNFVEERV